MPDVRVATIQELTYGMRTIIIVLRTGYDVLIRRPVGLVAMAFHVPVIADIAGVGDGVKPVGVRIPEILYVFSCPERQGTGGVVRT